MFIITYAWVVPLKVGKNITNKNAFQKNLDKFNRKVNKILVEKGSIFYIRPMKSWLEKDDIEMHSTNNEQK